MKKIILVTLLIFVSLSSNAQVKRTKKNLGKSKSERMQTQVPAPKEANWWFGPRFVFWQEKIPVQRGAAKADLNGQFMGAALNATRRGKFGSSKRWYHTLGLETAFGAVQAKNSNSSFPDYLKDQMWAAASLTPGILYRGTAVTDIYLNIPLTHRATFWKLSDPTFKVEREQSTSVGTTVLSASRFSPQTTFIAGFTHHWAWNATMWVLGFDYDF